jgi:restriction endonuclease Mrr
MLGYTTANPTLFFGHFILLCCTQSSGMLKDEGLLDVSDPDVWSLTEDGLRRKITEDEVLAIFKRIHRSFVTKKEKRPEAATRHGETEVEEQTAHKGALLNLLRSLAPEGFERLCQRLLRASGFKRVEVKGRSGDELVDGDKLVQLFEQKQLGLKPKTIYEIDHAFFEDYR